jgi:hypothetical protein
MSNVPYSLCSDTMAEMSVPPGPGGYAMSSTPLCSTRATWAPAAASMRSVFSSRLSASASICAGEPAGGRTHTVTATSSVLRALVSCPRYAGMPPLSSPLPPPALALTMRVMPKLRMLAGP